MVERYKTENGEGGVNHSSTEPENTYRKVSTKPNKKRIKTNMQCVRIKN